MRVDDRRGRHLDECLQSLAVQSVSALDIVVVDAGASAGSLEVARRWAQRDDRFRVISREAVGDGSSREVGAAAVDAEFLAFVEGEDVIPRGGLDLLLSSLDRSGSDFATGNVRRLTEHGTQSETAVAGAFGRSRRDVTLVGYRPLIVDQLVSNKLWRRRFWDEHSFRLADRDPFADIATALSAHLSAGAVDVVTRPVYLRRVNADDELAATQQLADIRTFRARVAAIVEVRTMLERTAPPKVAKWYDAGLVRQDLVPYLDVLDIADEEYRREAVETLRDLAAQLRPAAFEGLPSIDRLIWHLIGRGLADEAVEVIDLRKTSAGRLIPIQVGDRWYDDLPYRTDPDLHVPAEVYALDSELSAVVSLENMTWTDGALRVDGHAYIRGLGAPERQSQRVRVLAHPSGWRRVRVPLAVRRVHRPDLTADSGDIASLDWSGFSARFPRRLLRLGRMLGVGTWRLEVSIAAQGLERDAPDWRITPLLDRRVVERRGGRGRVLRGALSARNMLTVGIEAELPRLISIDVTDGVMRIAGDDAGVAGLDTLTVSGPARSAAATYPLEAAAGAFTALVPVIDLALDAELADDGADDDGTGTVEWSVQVRDRGGASYDVGVDVADRAPSWPLPGGRELAAYPTRYGALRLIERSSRPVIDHAEWTEHDELVISGRIGAAPGRVAVLRSRNTVDEHRIGLDVDDADARFTLRVPATRMPRRFASLPLEPGTWTLQLEDAPTGRRVPFAADPAVVRVRLGHRSVGGSTFALRRSGVDAVELLAAGDLGDRERGPSNQHRLRTERYPSASATPLRDAVTYLSFNGRQYSDNPRAIYDELSRQAPDVEHRWVVRQGRCDVPEKSLVVRELSEQYYDAMATSRVIVTNDYVPPWFVRRPGQLVLQTWHGHPLKRIGLDKTAMRKINLDAPRRQAESWTHVLSPSPVATGILARAFAVEGELLETGYPRTDVLFGPDVAARAAAVRERIGIPAGKRAVLYMPTYRDHLSQGTARYAMNHDLDLDLLRRELSDDHVLMVRKHHYVVGAATTAPSDFVIDVSGYPDATELLLAADVLVTDYSSAMFDWVSTGRPIVYFVPDLAYYRDELRGFYFDLEAIGPGPFVASSAEVVHAVRSAAAAMPQYAEKYRAFRSTYCSLADGKASSRVASVLLARLNGGDRESAR